MKFITAVIAFAIGAAIIIVGYALSWIITVGILWGIAWCFSIPFSIKIATGVWIVLCSLKLLLTSKNGNGNSR